MSEPLCLLFPFFDLLPSLLAGRFSSHCEATLESIDTWQIQQSAHCSLARTICARQHCLPVPSKRTYRLLHIIVIDLLPLHIPPDHLERIGNKADINVCFVCNTTLRTL